MWFLWDIDPHMAQEADQCRQGIHIYNGTWLTGDNDFHNLGYLVIKVVRAMTPKLPEGTAQLETWHSILMMVLVEFETRNSCEMNPKQLLFKLNTASGKKIFFIMYFSLPKSIPSHPLGGIRVRKHWRAVYYFISYYSLWKKMTCSLWPENLLYRSNPEISTKYL